MNAAAWAIDHFNLDENLQCTLTIDHKPLETMKTIHQRTMNHLMESLNEYDFDLNYKKGTEMPADILSRCPVDAVETDVTLIKEAQQDEFYQDLKAAFQGKQDFDQVKKPTIAKLLPNISEEKGLFYLQDDTRCVLILSQSLVPGVVQQASQGMVALKRPYIALEPSTTAHT